MSPSLLCSRSTRVSTSVVLWGRGVLAKVKIPLVVNNRANAVNLGYRRGHRDCLVELRTKGTAELHGRL